MAKNKNKVRRGTLMCYLRGHKWTQPDPLEAWQLSKNYVVGCCERCGLVGLRYSPTFIYWNEWGLLFAAHREQVRLAGRLDRIELT